MMDLPDWQYGFALIPKTALRPNQKPYFAFMSFVVPAQTVVTFTIEQGYDYFNQWVPLGKRFSIWWAKFSIDQNSLIETRVGVEFASAPGFVTWLAGQWGYGSTEYLAGVFFDFEGNSRPVYGIANYSSVDVTCDLTVFGVEESIL